MRRIYTGVVSAVLLLFSLTVLIGFFYFKAGRRGTGEIPAIKPGVSGDVVPVSYAPSQSAGRANFTDYTERAGIDFFHHQAEEVIDSLPQVVGSGVCLLDYDNDGDMDAYLVNGSGYTYYYGEKPWWYKPPTSVLYRNSGEGHFTDVTKKAGVGHMGWGMGCTVGDYNNDGYPDIYVTNYGKNVLYRNNGDGTFTGVTDKAGVGGKNEKWSTSAAWADYDNDGWLDLYVVNYIKFDKVMNPGEFNSSYQMPTNLLMNSKIYAGAPNILFHNNGDGTFTDVTKKAGIEDSAGKGLGVVFSDLDNDGDLDIYIANDGARNVLFRNNGNGTFTDIGGESKVDTPLSGMGITSGDYDNDGDFDLFSTYPANETNILYKNNLAERLLFKDVTVESGLGEDVSIGYFGWGTELFDYDNDGYLDLFIANGNPSPDFDNPRGTVGQRNQLFHNSRGMGFTDVSKRVGEGLKIVRSGRGAAFGDIDNDGDIDIIVNNNNDYATLLKNDGGNSKNWLTVRLKGQKSNRDGIGAKVSVLAGPFKEMREVRSSSSYLSQNDMRLHFGLDNEEKVETLIVRWPSGGTQLFGDIKANQFLTITEGTDKVQVDQVGKGPASQKMAKREKIETMQSLSPLSALKGGDPEKKIAALASLEEINDEAVIDRVIEPVIALLNDPDREVRKEAASLLCKLLKDEQTIHRSTIYRKRLAVVPLLKSITDPEADVRKAAIKALGYSESYRAVVPVAQGLKDQDREVRREAAITLGLLRDKRGIGPLLETLGDIDEEADVRSAAILSLIRLENDITGAPLLDQMLKGDEKMRIRAIKVLQSVLLEEESVLLKRRDIVPPLVDSLRDPSIEVRCEVVKAMALIKDPILVLPLIDTLSDMSVDVRKEAVRALGELRDKRGTGPLIGLLRDRDEVVRRESINSLSLLMDKKAIPPLLDIIMDKDEKIEIRLSAISSLRQIDSLQWSRDASLLLEDPAPEIRREAVRGLALGHDAEVVESLIRCLSDRDNGVRKEVVETLGAYKEKRVVDLLINIIKSSAEEKEIRSAAIASLAKIRDERAVIHLQGIARNNRDELRLEASNALKSFGGGEPSIERPNK